MDKIELARDSFRLAIATIRADARQARAWRTDAQHFFQSKNAAYLAMMELLVSQNKIADAFSYAERMRGELAQRYLSTRARSPTR